MTPATVAARPRILSGVQPSGKLHLGNYFGAIRQHIQLQDEGEAFYFVADYHALTTLPDAAKKEPGRAAKDFLADNVRDVALDYLALGLDPARAVFYRQSDVPEVTELAWVLSTVTGMGLLERAHSYKDKVANGLPASVGLFTYPVLMAADILIVRANVVPVGKDQTQHLEMTRDMAGYFNAAYGEVFPMPATHVQSHVGAVPGTDGRKMSKSYGNTIDIFAEGKPLKSAVMGIVTDSTPVDAPKNPDTCNVFAIYRLFATPEEQSQMAESYRDPLRNADQRNGRPFGYGDAKTALLKQIEAHFADARARRKQLAADPADVEAVLQAGAKRARAEARRTIALVRQAVGMAAAPAG
jgi:tryptophanyl-tRNA synthetase